MNPREILGVSKDASKSEIKQAFRNAAKEQHPDLSNSPEATEAFKKIKAAHDALMNEPDTPRESATVASAAARASAATLRTAYQHSAASSQATADIAHVQELDERIRKSSKSFFRRHKDSDEVKKHRKKIKTNNRRLRGLY